MKMILLLGCSRKDMTMRYKVVLSQNEDGYTVHCPGLPGCWSQGATEGEALENISSAIEEYLAAIADL
jgi:predicted RNase H-like HicB family nuclease